MLLYEKWLIRKNNKLENIILKFTSMKTRSILSIVTMCLLASCDDVVTTEIEYGTESSDMLFDATTEEDLLPRTVISGDANYDGCYSLFWEAGDAISLSDGINTAIFETENEGTSSAKFYGKEGKINEGATYTAFYPSTITASKMSLPTNQNYVYKNVESFPMRAVSKDRNLQFKNLCGIIRLSLSAEESGSLSISKISLSADNQGMSGTFTVNEDNAAVVKGTNGVVLTCSEPVSLLESIATDFNVIVPKGMYNPLKIKISCANGKEVVLVSTDAISVKRSEMTRISLTLGASSFESSLETIPITDSNVEFTDR